MNEKFFSLPDEKQQKKKNAGFRVFSQNSYCKSPMVEIAADAGISKSLLFHYFRNKKELYLFLWNRCAEITMEYLNKYKCYEPTDLFEMMERGMMTKFRIMELYPHMAAFAVKAFYEKDEQICCPGLDLKMMYREMYLASEGYLWEMLQGGELDVARMQKDFSELMKFWKSVYRRDHNEGDKN